MEHVSKAFDPGGPSASPKNVVAWNKLFTKAEILFQSNGSVQPSSNCIFLSDNELKSKLKECIHAKSCPTVFKRDDLLRFAIKLGLISEDDSHVVAPKKNSKQPKTWKQFVNRASEERFQTEPVSSDHSRVFAMKEMVSRLEAFVGEGQRAPQNLSRTVLLEQSVKTGLITQAQAENPLPERLTKEQLNALWKEHKDDRSRLKLASVPYSRERRSN